LGQRARRRERGAAAAAQPQPRRSRSAARDERARAQLEPLAPGERPTAVTVAAILAACLALANLIAFAAGLEIRGKTPNAFQVAAPAALMLVAAGGMWRGRYWAVLGFEAILGILIVYLAILLAVASNVLAVVVVVALIVPAGFLFWKLVRAMARLQMPAPPGGR
jgi:hypothetical protein